MQPYDRRKDVTRIRRMRNREQPPRIRTVRATVGAARRLALRHQDFRAPNPGG